MTKERIIIRIEKNKKFYEYGTPTVIWLDSESSKYKVVYQSVTGCGEGDYSAIIEQSRKATDAEVDKALIRYGIDKNEVSILQKLPINFYEKRNI